MEVYTVIIENINKPKLRKEIYLSEECIKDMFSGEWATSKIVDAKTNETVVIKDIVFKALKIKK